MNSEQIKNISIVDFLARQSVVPDKISHNGHTAIFKSPLRNEKTASFHVNIQKNVWYDHGIGTGGSLIDLVMRIEKIDFKETMALFQEKYSNHAFSFYCQNTPAIDSPSPRIEIVEVRELWHYGLKQYLTERKISYHVASKYTKEVHYMAGECNHAYFAIGFENEKGGYELRNKLWKGSNSPKYYSFINGTSHDQLTIYEGFFDFLSSLELSRSIIPQYDTIVLNSLSNITKCSDTLSGYEQVNLVLDNDPAGFEAVKVFQSHHHNVVNHSERLFPNHKDLNEYLTGKPQINSSKYQSIN
jgi:hypothetical protein